MYGAIVSQDEAAVLFTVQLVLVYLPTPQLSYSHCRKNVQLRYSRGIMEPR